MPYISYNTYGHITARGTVNFQLPAKPASADAATTATKFSSARTIQLTGNVTGSASSDGENGWSIATIIGAGEVTNEMLAGSITNGKLANSSITIGSQTVSLGGTATLADIGAMASNKTYTTSIAKDTSATATNITLEYGTKYKLSTGGTTYLFTMPASDNTNTHRPIQVNGTEILGNNTTALNLKAGTNVTLTNDGGTVTITSTDNNTDTKVTQAYSTANNSYPLLMTVTAGISSTNSRGDTTAILNNSIYANPSTGTVTATTFSGALSGTATGNITSVQYDSTNTKFTYTKNGSNTDIVTIANLKTYLGLGSLAYKNSLDKSDVGLGNVDNTADANKRVKGANITTTANAIAYYTDTAGTFGSKASANGALYATSANGALNWGTLPVAQGGTGATSFTANSVIISGSSSTAALTTRAITNITDGAVTASTDLITANSLVAHVANKIAAASNTYVTLNTAQTLTTNGTKTYLGLQTYGSSGLNLGTTSGSSVTSKANMKYDSTLDAIVFSFA